uniref:Neuropeptide Y-amide n=1 Tax=Delia radicum TaxID=30064 RepID=YAMD_DELRA|nr:RecName: Full=Neuropeptide Y-amide [Delia radicum]
LPSIGHYY